MKARSPGRKSGVGLGKVQIGKCGVIGCGGCPFMSVLCDGCKDSVTVAGKVRRAIVHNVSTMMTLVVSTLGISPAPAITRRRLWRSSCWIFSESAALTCSVRGSSVVTVRAPWLDKKEDGWLYWRRSWTRPPLRRRLSLCHQADLFFRGLFEVLDGLTKEARTWLVPSASESPMSCR